LTASHTMNHVVLYVEYKIQREEKK